MTATYNINNNIGKVRLTTGDKDLTDVIYTDEEIQVWLDANSNNINRASADLLEAWATLYGFSADSEKIGDYAYTQKIIANMLNLAKRLRETDASIPYLTWAEMDLSGVEDTTVSEDIE